MGGFSKKHGWQPTSAFLAGNPLDNVNAAAFQNFEESTALCSVVVAMNRKLKRTNQYLPILHKAKISYAAN